MKVRDLIKLLLDEDLDKHVKIAQYETERSLVPTRYEDVGDIREEYIDKKWYVVFR